MALGFCPLPWGPEEGWGQAGPEECLEEVATRVSGEDAQREGVEGGPGPGERAGGRGHGLDGGNRGVCLCACLRV